MDPSEWFTLFRATHEKFKKNELDKDDTGRYIAMREELARSLVAAQGLTVPDGTPARRFFRVAQAWSLEIDHVHRTLTRDVARAGFSAVVPAGFKEGQVVSFKLSMTRGQDPISGSAKIVAAPRAGSALRASFSIETLAETEGDRLETSLFDAVLTRLK
ncbi:MAG: hypothetical protein ACT4TC_12360 [Myxococcaceae bacterium]